MSAVEVDRERCVGSGNCEMLAPDVFEVGDDGMVALLRPLEEADIDDVRDAVAACPTRALAVAD